MDVGTESEGALLLAEEEEGDEGEGEAVRRAGEETLPGPGEVEAALVTAAFVATFDARTGNGLEWSAPHDAALVGVEFKAIASGAHNITSDFTYFRTDSAFGLAHFHSRRVDSGPERGVRVKSVGALSPSYATLALHSAFLQEQVRRQLDEPGQYEALSEFYEQYRAVLPLTTELPTTQPPSSQLPSTRTPLSWDRPLLQGHHAGCLSRLVSCFGPSVFCLWKLVLLRKRMLLYSPPPVGGACLHVLCCCCLGSHGQAGLGAVPPLKPLFYVSVADIGSLESEVTYIACTTEKVFEDKTALYDVYVDRQSLRSHHSHLQGLLAPTRADQSRYQQLVTQREVVSTGRDGSQNLDNGFLLTFFRELNARVLGSLVRLAVSGVREVTESDVCHMGLDPVADQLFLADLIDLYAINVTISADNPCCP
ncbi:DENN domain-containing protein 11 [Lampetra fluviatilis]